MSTGAEGRGDGFVRLSIDETDFLGVKISGHTRSMAGQLQSLRKGHGWIVRGDRIETWDIAGLIEHEGAIYAYGPYRDNTSLPDLLSGEPAEGLAHIAELVSALEILSAGSNGPGKFEPNLILFLEGGGLLFLPDELVEGVLSTQTESQRVAHYDPFNHPDLAGERNACFFAGVLAYRLLTGRLPFAADTSEEIHQRIRKQKILPAGLAVPDLHPALSEAIDLSLDASRDITLAQWSAGVSRVMEEGITREISVEERSQILDSAGKFTRSAESGYRRRVFLRKHWRSMAIVAAIVVIVGAVGGSILKNALKPRITVGMSPRQVVTLYYNSMTTFNAQAMQDCVIDGAGKEAIGEATNLYVISRVRQGYEGTTGYVAAQKWIDAGKPKLRPGVSVYGVADLKLTRDAEGVFTVDYQKWEPYESSSPNQPPADKGSPIMKVIGWQRADKVFLRDEGNYWAIYRIDHVINKAAGPPITVTGPEAAPRAGSAR